MSVALVRADTLCAWKASSLLITTLHGECDAAEPLSGFYCREARVLSTFRIEINGSRPWVSEAAATSPERLDFNYVYPEITKPGGGGTGQAGDEEGVDASGLPERSLDLRVSFMPALDGLDVALAITNRARKPLTFDVRCVVDADFADIQEAIARRREQTSRVTASASSGTIVLAYDHPQLPYRTEIRGDGWERADVADTGNQLATPVALDPQETKAFTVSITASLRGAALGGGRIDERERQLRRWQSRFTKIDVPGNREFGRVLARNIRDFGSFPLLDGEPDEWLVLQAGVPAYPAFFGRDAVTAGCRLRRSIVETRSMRRSRVWGGCRAIASTTGGTSSRDAFLIRSAPDRWRCST